MIIRTTLVTMILLIVKKYAAKLLQKHLFLNIVKMVPAECKGMVSIVKNCTNTYTEWSKFYTINLKSAYRAQKSTKPEVISVQATYYQRFITI